MANDTQKIIEAMENLAASNQNLDKIAKSFDRFDVKDLVEALKTNTAAQSATGAAFERLVQQEMEDLDRKLAGEKAGYEAEEQRQKQHDEWIQQSAKQMKLNKDLAEHFGFFGKAIVGFGKGFNILSVLMKKLPESIGNSIGSISKGLWKNLPGKGLLSGIGSFAKNAATIGKAALGGVKNFYDNLKTGLNLFLASNPIGFALKKIGGMVFSKTFGKILGVGWQNFKMAAKYGMQFSKVLIGLPLKIVGGLASKFGNTIRREVIEVIGQAVENTKEFIDAGSLAGKGLKGLADEGSKDMGRLMNIRTDMAKLFGLGAQAIAEMVREISTGIQNMGPLADTVGATIAKNEQSALYFVKATKSMGLAAAEVQYLTAEAVKNGESLYDSLDRVMVSISKTAKSSGLDQKRMSKNFFELRKDITNFGHLSDAQLAQTTAKITQMGLSMKEASAVFGKIDTFESAAQTSAMLSQTFGMNLDALQLLRAEKPEEIIEQFRDAMLSTGRAFDDLNRHEKALMAQHTGLTDESLKLMMNYRNLGMSYAEIQKKMKEDDPTQQQIKNLEMMSGSLKEIKKTMEGQNFFKAFANGVVETITKSSGLAPHLMRISERIEDFYIGGLTVSKKATEAMTAGFKPLTDLIVDMVGDGKGKKGLFDSDKMKKTFEDFSTSMGTFLGRVFSGEDLELLQYEFAKNTSNFFSFSNLDAKGNIVGELMKSSGKIIGQMLKAFAALGPGLIQTVNQAFHGLADLLDGGGFSFTGGESVKDKLMKLFGLNMQDANAIQNTFNYLIDTLTSNIGPFARLFVWVQQKLAGLAADFGKAASEAAVRAIPGSSLFLSDYSGSKVKGLDEARKSGLQGNVSAIEDLAKKMESEVGYFNDDEEELAKLGGKMQYVLNQMERTGTAKDKRLLKEFFERANMTRSELLDVKKLDDNYEALQDLAAFIKGKRDNFNMITLDAEKINGRLQDAKRNLLGPGMMATVKSTPNGVKVLQHATDDITLTAKPSEVSYAGNAAAGFRRSIPTSQMVQSQSSQNIQPIIVKMQVDGNTIAEASLDADLIYKAMNPIKGRHTLPFIISPSGSEVSRSAT